MKQRQLAETGAMLAACRLAGPSALETYYAEVRVRAQFGPTQRSRRPSSLLARAGRTWASGVRPEAQAMDAGPPGRL